MKYIFSFFVFIFLLVVPVLSNATKLLVSRPSAQEISQAIVSASNQTKVRAAVLYGLLGQETGYGRYLGKTVNDWTSFCSNRNTLDCQNWRNYDCHSNYRNARHLDEILAHLGYAKKDILTSSTCALGFTQFEPNTWWEVLNGNLQGLNPYNIDDAVLMSAYYLEDLGADKTKTLLASDVFSAEDYTALQRYYCGGNYTRLECGYYAKSVENKAKRAAPELLALDYENRLGILEEQRSAIRKKLKLPEAPRIEVPKIQTRYKPPEEEVPVVLTITPKGNLPDAIAGEPYFIKFSASGGTPPYSWTFILAKDGGQLPKGLYFDSSEPNAGTLSGTPIEDTEDIAGERTTYYDVEVSDSKGRKHTEFMRLITRKQLSVLPFILFSGRVGLPYEEWLQYIGGGHPPYTWKLFSGSLPPGLSLSHKVFMSNDPAGVISGIPTAGGGFDFILEVTDSRANSVTRAGHIKIKPAPQQPISITGRMVDRFSKKPIDGVFLRTITPNLEEYEEEDVHVGSDEDGRFVTLVDGAKAGNEDIYINHSANCYDEDSHRVVKYPDGNLEVQLFTPDFINGDINNSTVQQFQVVGAEVDIGDVLLWPAVSQLLIYSDIKVAAEVEYKENSLGGQANFANEHYLSEAIRLNIPMRVKLTDQAGSVYYSPLITMPLNYGCKEVTLRFSAGQFKWELTP